MGEALDQQRKRQTKTRHSEKFHFLQVKVRLRAPSVRADEMSREDQRGLKSLCHTFFARISGPFSHISSTAICRGRAKKRHIKLEKYLLGAILKL